MARAGGCAEKSDIYLNGREGLNSAVKKADNSALARAWRAEPAVKAAG
jgi:hypothetical protein